MNSESEAEDWTVEEELLLAVTNTRRSAKEQARLAEILRTHTLDWDWVIQMATIHRIRSLLHIALGSELSQFVPAERRAQFRAFYMFNVSRNMELTQESVRIARILQEAGVDSIAYKGPLQASRIYGNIALREIGDIDTIIHPRDLSRAKTALCANGYSVDSHYDQMSDGEIVAQKNMYNIALWRADQAVYLELHWKVMPAHSWYGYHDGLLWEHLEQRQVGDVSVQVLRRDLIFTMLCVHNEKHNWNGLRYLNDVAVMLKTMSDLECLHVLEQARMWGKLSSVLITCNLCARLLGAELPIRLTQEIHGMRMVEGRCAAVRARLFNEEEFRIPSYREWRTHYRKFKNAGGRRQPAGMTWLIYAMSILSPEYRDKRHFVLVHPNLTIIYVFSRIARYVRWNWIPRRWITSAQREE